MRQLSAPKTLEDIVILCCKRCGHHWTRRVNRDPAQCPGCRSPYWNRERVRAVSAKRKPIAKQQSKPRAGAGGKKRRAA